MFFAVRRLKMINFRYDAYWEKRRGVGRDYESYESRPRPRLRYSPLSDNWRYSPQYRTDEGSGAQLPLEKSSVNDPEVIKDILHLEKS